MAVRNFLRRTAAISLGGSSRIGIEPVIARMISRNLRLRTLLRLVPPRNTVAVRYSRDCRAWDVDAKSLLP